ncbi:tyrosine-protein kinase receptor old-1 isoform X1 [Exaiptasia diaphana]|uniref:Protein kinase domain-containing protein n=1 Tax=Exaiptasia diaphana TaxID=2652724 RepID=A0A913Y969_EXADI|nr:tyrosine-protein kinase receptor old-1 isoform X1 [Exaiptasia diaphana]
MGDFRQVLSSAVQRLVGKMEDESQNVFEFKSLDKGGVPLFFSSAISYEPLTFKGKKSSKWNHDVLKLMYYSDHFGNNQQSPIPECIFMTDYFTIDDNTGYVDHSGNNQQSPIPECIFMTDYFTIDDNTGYVDHSGNNQQSPIPECIFMTDYFTIDDNTGYVDHSGNNQQSPIPECISMTDNVTTDDNTGYVDHSSNNQQSPIPECIFMTDYFTIDDNTGYVDHSGNNQQSPIPECIFMTDYFTIDDNTGYVDHSGNNQQSPIPECISMTDNVTTDDNTGYVDHSSNNQQSPIPECIFMKDNVTTNSSAKQQEADQIMELQDHPVPDPDQKRQKRGYQPPVPDAQLEDHHMQPLNHEDGTDDGSGSSSQVSNNYEQMPCGLHIHSIEELKNGVHKKFLIDKRDLTWKNKLGEGQFGIVYEGIWSKVELGTVVPKKKRVAMKELRRTADDKSQEDFIKEAINMSKLAVQISSKHIIKFIGICLDENEDISKLMIITELAPFGNLKLYLNKVKEKGDTFKLSVLVDFCVQICNGMADLESNNVLHRDIALRNILVASEDPYLIKISDFGLARLSEYYKCERGRFPLKWYAPESITYHRFTSKSDVWSFGVAMWEVFSYGAQPYPEIKDCKMIIYHICKGNRLPKPVNCPDDIYNIMKQCWDYDPKSRPSFYELSSSLLDDIKNKYCKQEQ